MFEKIKKNLIYFQKPARYIGNELGIPNKDFSKSAVRFVISYPDIYEVGMSNLGIKIVYDYINSIDFASCERVFSPWIDFEAFLRENDIPLFSLETKTPINEFDFLGVSIQYELLFSNFLNLLSLSKIPLFNNQRDNKHPIIILGGPSVINPLPYSPFADLIFIGEVEDIIEPFLKKYYELKKDAMSRETIIKELAQINGVFSSKFSSRVKKNIFTGFNQSNGLKNYIIPNIQTVHDKLIIEIMRGCPNKCRFCLAGLFYKPNREKDINSIFEEVENGIKKSGSNEVTFASLSSGDYSQILKLTEKFIEIYSDRYISFSLPSLKVETFNIEILSKINSVRKSGLTFAIETPTDEGQKIINKEVDIEKISNIIRKALEKGWKIVKLYFMIGLPYVENEKEDIIKFIDRLLSIDKKLKINLNIAVFVPKPFTPFQYERQMPLYESIAILNEIERYYRKTRVTVKKHDPYASYIEGFIARGDEKIGLAVYDAFLKGAKFDGWKEQFKFDIYKESFEKNCITYEEYLAKKDIKEKLKWDIIDIGIDDKFYKSELEKVHKKQLDKNCNITCDKFCDICNNLGKKSISEKLQEKLIVDKYKEKLIYKEKKICHFLIKFTKVNDMKYISHIDLIRYFERLFIRADIPITYTQGFNPHPKFRFSLALPLGVESISEYLDFFTDYAFKKDELLSLLKDYEHKDLKIIDIKELNSNKNYNIFKDIVSNLYYLFFDKNKYEIIAALVENFPNIDITKENISERGKLNFKDCIFLEELDSENSFIKIKVVSKEGLPNILKISKIIFNDNIEKILKVCSLNKNDYDFFESFDIGYE